MEENNKIKNFEDALSAIDTISKSFSFEIWIPSKQKNVIFKEIDAKQQKKLLNSAMNSSVYNTNFIKDFYQILKENLLDKEFLNELDNLTIFDKYCIAIALKSKISKEINVTFDSKQNISKQVNLTDILSKFKVFSNPPDETLSVDSNDVMVSVTVSLPTIGLEHQYENQIHKSDKTVEDIKSTQDVQKIVADAFLGETSKYIKNIKINEYDLNFESYNFNEKIKIVEKLPSGIIQKILEIVSKWKKEVDYILTVETEVDGNKYSKTLTIDGVFFLS
jgi:hypothetical protein